VTQRRRKEKQKLVTKTKKSDQETVMKNIFIIFLFISSALFAQEPLRLQDAINIALKNSYDIQLAKNNVDTAWLQYKTLKKGLWKYLIFSAEKK